MTDENNDSTTQPEEGEDPSPVNTAPVQGSGDVSPDDKGGADGKTKALGGKVLGDHGKASQNERDYD